MLYENPTFTLPAAPPKISQTAWDAIFHPERLDKRVFLSADQQAVLRLQFRLDAETVKVAEHMDHTFTSTLPPNWDEIVDWDGLVKLAKTL